MGIFDNDLILPGTVTEISSDYSYGYDTSLFGTTDSVTLLGTAFNGPVGMATEIYSPEHAAYIFGESYDYATRREATLVAEIKNAWDRGCRTIYAVRVSGQHISKDFSLIPETKLKLRVSGLFPSNSNKEIYMTYDSTAGAEAVKIYKPAKRATMQEKMEGLVENDEAILVSTIEVSNDYSLTKDSTLVELIKVINEHQYNNVLKLSIVDENGSDVTASSKEAKTLPVGAMFGGAYFIGRDKNLGIAQTDVQYVFTTDESKPYDSFDEFVYKKLVFNSDVTSSYPIFSETVQALNSALPQAVSMTKMFDFLSIPGKANLAFKKNTVDYEEVDISDFELYNKLGSGFATTAVAKIEGGVVKKVMETPVSDPNRIVGIQDGIYSMLENLSSDYRVLTNAYADSEINGKLPKKEEFIIMKSKTGSIKNLIQVDAIVDKKDFTDAKKYIINIDGLKNAPSAEEVKATLYAKKVIKSVSVIPFTDIDKPVKMAEGTLAISDNSGTIGVYRISDGVATQLTGANMADMLILHAGQVYKTKLTADVITAVPASISELRNTSGATTVNYLLVESAGAVFVYNVGLAGETPSLTGVTPLGGIAEVFNSNDDKTFIVIESDYGKDNIISIKSTEFDYMTVEEFINVLNEDKDLKRFFYFKMTSTGTLEKDSVVSEALVLMNDVTPATCSTTIEKDRESGADASLYIPYKTSDNFARHLAQHCTYTSLKTAPTHGVIGCAPLMDVNLTSVAKKVDAMTAMEYNLVAKKTNGRDMLDGSNLPYPIGKNVSMVLGQYSVNTLDGYSYTSTGAAGYAGMVSILPLDQSSTNQPINIPNPMYELTNYQLGKLTKKGYVTFKLSYTKGYVVTDGVTVAPVSSPHRRLSVTRITNAMEEVIRTATEPFIGKQNHLTNRNSMQTAIKSGLDNLKGKLIEAYEFKLSTDSASTKLGIINIEYRVVPIYEIREVRNKITVGESLN